MLAGHKQTERPFMQKFFARLAIAVFIALTVNFHGTAQPNTNEQLAIQYFQNKEFDKAVILFEEIYNKAPTPFIYDYYLNCLIELKDYNKAEKFTAKVIRKNPGNYALLVDLGYIYELENEPEKAKKQFENTSRRRRQYRRPWSIPHRAPTP